MVSGGGEGVCLNSVPHYFRRYACILFFMHQSTVRICRIRKIFSFEIKVYVLRNTGLSIRKMADYVIRAEAIKYIGNVSGFDLVLPSDVESSKRIYVTM